MTKKQLIFLLGGVFAAYFALHVYGWSFSNYLESVHRISPSTRGWLEFPRELPGIIALFAVGLLFFLRENRIAALAVLLCAIGLAALAIPMLSSFLTLAVVWIVVISLGEHMLMVVLDATVIHNSKPENRSVRMGQMRAFMTAAGLAGSFYLWLGWYDSKSAFSTIFWVSAAACFISMIFFLGMHGQSYPEHRSIKERFIFKKRYRKYYLLEVFFGARKQIFITFGFWVLVYTLGKSPEYIGKIMIIAGIGGIFFKPFVGKLVQLYGERIVLSLDAVVLVVICVLYAFALNWFDRDTATMVISGCFIVDSMLFAIGVARSNYIARIAEKKEHITPSLYTGMAINHVTSILCGVGGGLLWAATGTHVWTFLAAGLFGVCSGLTALTIRN
jgi:predicted MFS family arabinose efflux permease